MSKNFSLFLFFLTLALSGGAFTASAQTPAQEAFDRGKNALKANPADYRAPLDSLRKYTPAADDATGTDIHAHAMSIYQSFAGNYDSALYYFDKQALAHLNNLEDRGVDAEFAKENYFRNALSALPKKIAPHRVVMLNEAYYMPSHRAFAINLLDELHKQGFRHIAIETLAASDTAQLNKRKYPTHQSGTYQKEPLYGELMRQALKKGFTLIGYDSEVECTPIEEKGKHYCNNFRDSVQAQNLARWIKKNGDKKLFVYTGPSQIFEQSNGNWIRMAQYFKRFTGINPYTIDQVYMTEHLTPALEDPRFRAAADLKNIQAPMVAYVEDTLWSHSKQVDATVFHPRYLGKTGSLPHYQVKHKRPDFYLLHNQRRPILISKDPKANRFSNELLPANTSMIMAFYQKEEGDRVPADVIELKKDQEEAILYLYPGAYEIIYMNKAGRPILKRPMVVTK